METVHAIAEPRGASQSYLGRHIHLIGIGGCGMRALAQMLLGRGAIISGSDAGMSGAVQTLSDRGATVHVGQRAENLPDPCDLVVYSAAIRAANPELLEAGRRGLEVVKYSQMLGRLMSQGVGIAVSGTHGKSTTTAMVAYVLSGAGMDPSFIVGATVEQLSGPSGVGQGKHFVAEACEFDRSFLNLHPHYAAVLNIEEDHLDCYQDLDAIVEAFRAFVAGVQTGGVVIANGEDRNVARATEGAACEVQTFGLTETCTWRGVNLQADRGRYSLEARFGGREFCRLALKLPGLHNAYNALAATALLYHAGLGGPAISTHLGRFAGTHRRMTLKGCRQGVTVLDDYAHHPTEIQVTLKAIREHYQPRRLFCVFQPHQHSRTRFLLKDFARSFASADQVLVPDIYFVRDSVREKDYISSQDLVAQIRLNGGAAEYLTDFSQIVSWLREQLREGDLVVTMGAGNVYEVADQVILWLGGDC
jgi:UDP-N-acetylmuramate--alanine ligase